MASRVVVNELSECYANVTFLDQNGLPYTPTAIQWRLDNLTDEAQVTAWTIVTPTGPTMVFTIPSASNSMLSPSRNVQTMEIAFKITAPSGGVRYDYAQYDLVRIYNVP